MRGLSRPLVAMLCISWLCVAYSGDRTYAAGELPRQIAIDAGRFDPEKTEFALANVGSSSDQAWMIGGHLVLIALSDLGDYAFDWGIFDSTRPNFIFNYMRGILNYEHIVRPAAHFLRGVSTEGREVVLRPIKLTTEQKRRVIAELVRWRAPENRIYAYDVALNNCATVIRDILFAALGENFRADLATPAGFTGRDVGRSAFGHIWYVYVLGEAAFGTPIDRLQNKWELVYLPLSFPEVLADLSAYDDAGDRIPGSRLLAAPRTVLAGKNQGSSQAQWTLWIGLGMGALILALLAARQQRAFKIVASVNGVILMILSLLIIWLWTASRHVTTHDNVNLAFYWPVDLVLVRLSAANERLRRFTRGLAIAHLAIGTPLLALWAIGIVTQDLSGTAAFVLPIWAGVLYVFTWPKNGKLR